jgi:serine phosphatase RsbU (regulator of sigma subunit)
VRSKGGIEELESLTFAPGTVGGLALERVVASASMVCGDRLVVISDGITDACPELRGSQDQRGYMYGHSRLERFVQENRRLDPGELCTRLLADVVEHRAGAPQDDDMIVLVIEFRGTTERPDPVGETPTSEH